jgi:hypothetical protein
LKNLLAREDDGGRSAEPSCQKNIEQKTERKLMNRFTSFQNPLRSVTGLALAALAVGAFLITGVMAADSKPDTETKSANKAKATKLSGADLYAIHCNRCHPERYATERTAAQWKTIMLHMRVRAYLPASQAKEILKYLQEDAGK